MRYRSATLTILVLGSAALLASPILAFHDEGVAHCNGCHTMHNSQNGVEMNLNAAGSGPGTAVGTGHPDLLLFANKNDVCLRCHAGQNTYHVWANSVLDPGAEHGAGNFVFLEEDNLNDGHSGGSGSCDVTTCGAGNDAACTTEADCVAEAGNWTWSNPIPGSAAGHTLASGIKGTIAEPGTAPGGTYVNSDLNCSSCHDPHGNDAFRLLYKAGQSHITDSLVTVTFNTTLDATGIGLFHGPGGDESNTNHNAYRSGYSEWCSTCHGLFHDGGDNMVHPSGELMDTAQLQSYAAYEGTQDCIDSPGDPCGSGLIADAYLAEVPFEDAANLTVGSTMGPTATSKVACVSCHRAHASSAPDAGRWDFDITGLEEDGHESGSWKIPNPYGPEQRSLCNKCHSQDEYDAALDFTP